MNKTNFKRFSLVAALAMMLQVVSCAEPATFSWGGLSDVREVKVFDQINTLASITAFDSAGNNYITKVEVSTETEGCQIDDKGILSLTDEAKEEYLEQPKVCVVDYKLPFGGKIQKGQKEFKFVEGMESITISGAFNSSVVIGKDFDVLSGVTAKGDNTRDLTSLITYSSDNCTITEVDGKAMLDTSELKVCVVKYSVKDYYDMEDVEVTREVSVIDPDAVVNLIRDGSFEGTTLSSEWWVNDYVTTTVSEKGLEMKMDVSTSGAAHEPQLTQANLPISKGKLYVASFKASSTIEREIELRVQEVNTWVSLAELRVTLTPELTEYKVEFLVYQNLTNAVQIGFMLGKLGDTAPQGEHTVTLDDVVIDEMFDYFGNPLMDNSTLNIGPGEDELLPDGSINFWYVADLSWNCGALSSADAKIENGKLIFDVKATGDNDWSLQFFHWTAEMFFDGDYVVSFEVNAQNARKIKMNDQVFELDAGVNTITLNPVNVEAGERIKISTQFGKFGGETELGKLEFSNFRVTKK